MRNQKFSPDFKKLFRWLGISGAVGILAGAASSLVLFSLDFATRFRGTHPELIWLLPLGGLLIGGIYRRWSPQRELGTGLILDEIHDPKSVLPARMSLMVFFGTFLTHLLGGSAGREGTAVQMGASLADQLYLFFPLKAEERKVLLVAGAGAGFSAAIGAPWAGILFGMEVIQVGALRLFAIPECLIASFMAYHFTHLVRAPHSVYPSVGNPEYSLATAGFVVLAGVIFGVAARSFIALTHGISSASNRYISFSPLRPFFAGILLVILYRWEGTYRFVGLGIDEIQLALQAPVDIAVPFFKGIFTAITVGSGFKGGEFIPLVFVGTALGNLLSQVTPLSLGFAGALGFAATFGAAANTPLACTVMAMELFGWQIGPYALLACLVSFYCSGHKGIYAGQKVHMRKHEQLLRVVSLKKIREVISRR